MELKRERGVALNLFVPPSAEREETNEDEEENVERNKRVLEELWASRRRKGMGRQPGEDWDL